MSEIIQGLSLGLGLDTAGIDLGMKQLRGKLAMVNAEMKANLSAFDYGEKSVAKYQTQLDGLNKKLEVQKTVVSAARAQYEKMVAEHGEGSKQAERAAAAFNKEVAAANNLQRSVDKLGAEFKGFQDELAQSESKLGKFSSALDGISAKISEISGRMSEIGSNMTASMTAPIAGFGALAIKSASDFETAQGKIQAQLGLTAEQAKELNEIAENLWKQGFGESIGEANDAVVKIYQTMGNLPVDELERVTAAAFTLGEVFEVDVNETARAAGQLMQQFGVSSTDAMDMLTVAFQKGGNYSDELLDSVSEYSTQFANMGFSAEQMMGMFASGAESGIFSVDKLADTVKESFLQITDGADNTRSALSELGLDYNQIEQDMAKGGEKANAAFGVVMTAIAGVSNEADRNRLAIELMGTPLEDLGPQYQSFFADVGEGMTGFEGAAEKAGESMHNNFGERLQSTLRAAQDSLRPLGEVLVVLAERWIPKITSALQTVTEKFTSMSPAMQNFIAISGVIVAALGPVITAIGFFAAGLGGLIGFFGRLAGPITKAISWLSKLGPSFTAIRTAIGVLSGPIGWVTLAVTGLAVVVYKNWDSIKAKTLEVFGSISNFLTKTVPQTMKNVSDWFANAKNNAVARVTELKNGVVSTFSNTLSAVTGAAEDLKNNVSNRIATMKNNVVSRVSELKNNAENTVSGMRSRIVGWFTNMKDDVSNRAAGLRDNVYKAFVTTKSKAEEIIGKIKKSVSGLWTDIVSGAKGLPKRISDGISSMAGNVVAGVKTMINKLGSWMEKGLNGAIKGLNEVLEFINVGTIKEIDIPGYKRGTRGSGHPGGLAMVNDAKGSDYQELIQTPDGKIGMFQGRNIIANLPKGTKVLPGDKTKQFLKTGIPRYEEGIGDFWDFLDKPKELLQSLYDKYVPKIELSGAFGDIAKGSVTYVKDKAVDFIKEKIASVFVGDGWTGEMEKSPHAVGPGSGFGGMMKYVEYWYNQVKDRFGPTRFMGAYNNRNVRGGNSKSMHAYGRAFDIGGSHETMSKIADYLRKTATNLQYVIYNRRIAGPGVGKAWRAYGGVNPHTDHVHADFLAQAGGGSNIKGGAAAWRSMILKAAAQMNEAVTPAQVEGIIAQIHRESKGDPKVFQSPLVNDINMRNGTPARGLLQYIPSTFKNYMLPGYTDILNGYHQLIAFFNNTNWRKDLPYGKRGWGPTGSRKYANGTDFHPGGPAVVNDQKGPVFKEIIKLPSGSMGMFEERNVHADFPKGTQVIPAKESKRILESAGIPHYASGTGGSLVQFGGKPAEQVTSYIVKAGDTLSDIAKKFKTTVNELVKLNNIKNPDLIKVGQKIIYGITKAVQKIPASTTKPIDHRPEYVRRVASIIEATTTKGKSSYAERLKLLEDYVTRAKEANQLSLVDEIYTYRESLKYFKKGSAEQIAVQKKLNEAKKQLNDELMQMQDDYLSKMKEVNDKLIEEEKRLNEEYENAVNARADSLKGFAGLFDAVEKPEEVDPLSLIDKLQSQIWTLNNFDSNLDILAGRGVDQALIEELQAMGPQALAEIKALNNMTETQLSQFQELWKEKSAVARSRAVQEMEGMRVDTANKIAQLREDAEKEIAALNKTFEQQVSALKTIVTTGLNPGVAQMKDIGKNVIQGLIDGMKSMNSPLESVSKGLAESIKKAITTSLIIKSPSRWMKAMVGENIVQGVIDGIDGMKRAAITTASTMADWFKPSLSPISLQSLQDFTVNKPTDAMKLLALAARAAQSGNTNGNANSGQVPNVSTQNKQEINVQLVYHGSASQEDVMGMVDLIEEELARRARIKMLVNGV